MKKTAYTLVLVLGWVAAACNAPVGGGTAGVGATATATAGPAATAVLPPATIAPLPPAATPAAGAEETIMIIEPGPGSRVISPLHVAGWADPTFEQTLSVRLMSFEGGEIAPQLPVQIQADVGLRGPFSVEIPFAVSEERNALLQVLSYSPRDGGVTHLSSVGVTLLPGGAASLVTRPAYPEQIAIMQPGPGSTVSGGVAHVEGVAVASFEGTLVVELYDEAGNLLASEPLIVEAPDMGLPGTFSINLAYSLASAGPGRVVVLDPSPAFDGVNHLSSVDVQLEP